MGGGGVGEKKGAGVSELGKLCVVSERKRQRSSESGKDPVLTKIALLGTLAAERAQHSLALVALDVLRYAPHHGRPFARRVQRRVLDVQDISSRRLLHDRVAGLELARPKGNRHGVCESVHATCGDAGL